MGIKAKIRKITGIIGIIGLSLGACILTGCSENGKNETEILNDFVQEHEELSFLDFHTLEVEKRQTNKSDKTDIIYANVIGSGPYADHSYKCKFLYNYYDEGGWILDDLTIDELEVSNISWHTDEEIEELFTENENYLYITNMYYDTLHGTIKEKNDSVLEQVVQIEMGEGGVASPIVCSAQLAFDMAGNGEIPYTVNGSYYLEETYDIYTGQWYFSNSSYSIDNQTINFENIIWLAGDIGSDYYTYGKLVEEEEGVYSWWEKEYIYGSLYNRSDISDYYYDDDGWQLKGLVDPIDLVGQKSSYHILKQYFQSVLGSVYLSYDLGDERGQFLLNTSDGTLDVSYTGKFQIHSLDGNIG